MPPFRRLAHFAAVAMCVLALAACEEVVNDLLGSFDPDTCCRFEFWRNDTLLVRTVVLPAQDETEDDPEVEDECLSADWRFKNVESWLKYEIPEGFNSCSDDFKAEIHYSNDEYFEVVGQQVESGSHGQFAEGWWKLHVMRGDIDDIVDGGDFLFWFRSLSECD